MSLIDQICEKCHQRLAMKKLEFRSNDQSNTTIETPVEFSCSFVLKHHLDFRDGIRSLKNSKKLRFFSETENEEEKLERPILLYSPWVNFFEQDEMKIINEKTISIENMKINQVYENEKILLWVVTQPEITNLSDGTIYLVVHDTNHFHIRLVISNWSYSVSCNERTSNETLNRTLNELLPIESCFILSKPCLMKCSIDGQFVLRCNVPNINLKLIERFEKFHPHFSLEDLRKCGNEAFTNEANLLAFDYYTFAINLVDAMLEIALRSGDIHHLISLLNSAKCEIFKIYCNRSACYLKERFYRESHYDSTCVITAKSLSNIDNLYYLKSLYRFHCSNFGLNNYSSTSNIFFRLHKIFSENPEYKKDFAEPFQKNESQRIRLTNEHRHGIYDLKNLLKNESNDCKVSFDVERFHSNYKEKNFLSKSNEYFYAKTSIPSGTLLLVDDAFVYINTGQDEEQRLFNSIEKRLFMKLSIDDVEELRESSLINEWFETETEAEFGQIDSYPETFPYGLLVEAQRKNIYRSKKILGWWSQSFHFQIETNSKKNANCLWLVCDSRLFIFTFRPVSENELLIVADRKFIGNFLRENRKTFKFVFNSNEQILLDEIYDDLYRSQCYFE